VSYHEHLEDSPEVEIVCGGLNEKDSQGGALWRQGHLFHFAFDLSPGDMNENGQALLLNSIAYITRFTEDRPIAPTPSGWAENKNFPRNRRWIQNLFKAGAPENSLLDFYLDPVTKAEVGKMDRFSYTNWYQENAPFLTSGTDGRLLVDSTAKELRIPFDGPDFFPKAIEKLRQPATAAKARALLQRYAPDGTSAGLPDDWGKWWQENRPYLFFSEHGGYRWYVDPLAKRRGIPSNQLRGPARASRP
jgi:hypothetical protein